MQVGLSVDLFSESRYVLIVMQASISVVSSSNRGIPVYILIHGTRGIT